MNPLEIVDGNEECEVRWTLPWSSTQLAKCCGCRCSVVTVKALGEEKEVQGIYPVYGRSLLAGSVSSVAWAVATAQGQDSPNYFCLERRPHVNRSRMQETEGVSLG
jgi:hypothetical protein